MNYYVVTPFQEGVGSLGNASYFVILAGVGASMLYLLLKHKKLKLINLIIGFALTAAIFMLSVVYLEAVFSVLVVPHIDLIVLPASFVVTALADYALLRARNRVSNLAILLLGGALGAFLGISIPTLSAILILGFLAVYDAFAVFHGPVGKIANSGLEKLRGLSFSHMDVQIGLGDLTFYSMLACQVLVSAGPLFCLASTVGVLIGVFLALKMLEKKGIFPGLPFPVALGLAPLIISLFL
jgi:presenilin-like A22 family membrane protease